MGDTDKMMLEELGREVRKMPLEMRFIGTAIFNLAESAVVKKAKDATTITALQARVAELEAERGHIVAWQIATKPNDWRNALFHMGAEPPNLIDIDLSAHVPNGKLSQVYAEMRPLYALTPPVDLTGRIKGGKE